jgi:hypothetical protein
MSASLTYENGVLAYRTPYSPRLVEKLKAVIPASDRRWEPGRKLWLVAPQYAQALVQLTADELGENIGVPVMPHTVTTTETRILDVRYVGLTKDRGNGERSAFGWCNGEWSVILPEAVLRQWFGVDMRPDESPTLYGTLGLKQDAEASDVKRAYRRLSLQWHPDRCKEPDAAAQFIKIQHAYEVLSNQGMRARYDAGLALEATTRMSRQMYEAVDKVTQGYRSPLRCGYLMATGIETLGRFVVSEIHAWEDITDAQGRTLSTSWPMGATQYVEAWL